MYKYKVLTNMDDKMAYIYKITNTETNKAYVGKTNLTIQERFNRHIRNSSGGQTHLYKSMKKYGIDKFNIELLEECEPDKLDQQEIYWIDELKTLMPNGYNMTIGGDGGDTSNSPNFILAMEKMHSQRSPEDYATYGMLGKKQSDHQKENQSKHKKDWWANKTEEELKSFGDKIKGKKNGMFGKTPKNAIKVIYDEVEYPSIAAASRATGVDSKHFIKIK